MTIEEKVAELETRIEQLETALVKVAAKPSVSFQRMVDDERGRGMVVTVGGNN